MVSYRIAVLSLVCLMLGACASQDKHAFDSTAHLPTTVSLLDTTNDTVFWKMEVPVGCRLKLDFDRPPEFELASVNPTFPATKMKWTLHDKDSWSKIKEGAEQLCGTPYLIKVSYRDSPEVPDCPPGSCLQVADGLQLSAERPGAGVTPAPVQVTVNTTPSEQWQQQYDAATAPQMATAPTTQPASPQMMPAYQSQRTAATPVAAAQPYPSAYTPAAPAPASQQPVWTPAPAPAPTYAGTATPQASGLGQVNANDYYTAPPPVPTSSNAYTRPMPVTAVPMEAVRPVAVTPVPVQRTAPATQPQPVSVKPAAPKPLAAAPVLPALPAPATTPAPRMLPMPQAKAQPKPVVAAPPAAPALPALPTVAAATRTNNKSTGYATPDFSLSPSAAARPSANGSRMVPLKIKTDLLQKYEPAKVSILVEGVPLNATLSAGRNNGSGIWTLSGDQLSGLSMALPPGINDDVQLMIIATAPTADGDTDSTVSNMIVKVSPLAAR